MHRLTFFALAEELREAIRRARRCALRATIHRDPKTRKQRLPEIQLARLIVSIEELAEKLESEK